MQSDGEHCRRGSHPQWLQGLHGRPPSTHPECKCLAGPPRPSARNYRLRLFAPPGTALVDAHLGAEDLDSDFDPVTARTPIFSYVGDSILTLDARLVVPVGYLFADSLECSSTAAWSAVQ